MVQQKELDIIIIDDNPASHQTLAKILAKFHIDSAYKDQEALELVKHSAQKNKRYSIAFVGAGTSSSWDAHEIIKHIWASDPDVQIVIYAAVAGNALEAITEKFGVRGNLVVLRTPFDNETVLQFVAVLAHKWQLIQHTKLYDDTLASTHDLLTGLPNRVLLTDLIHHAMAEATKNNSMAGVFLINLDRFKLVNDSLNHDIGDELLQEVSKRLSTNLHTVETLARLYGDEFAFVVPLTNQEHDVEALAAKILNNFKIPYRIKNREITITASIGVSVFPEQGKTAEELLRNARLAMYNAKESGMNRCQVYNTKIKQRALTRLKKETELRQALSNNEFFICYQPQYSAKEHRVVAVEALIRWQHPEKGVVSPADFIPTAEESELIVPIGEWVLKTACKQNKLWQNSGLPPIRLSVNVASQQFKHPDFAKIVKNILDETGLKPEFLELEATENVVITSAGIIEMINELSKLGVKVALDDFGIGNSNLNYLGKIPISHLKIDKSFVENIGISQNDEIIIQAMISMAHTLKLSIIAEGVESKAQLDFLEEHKCDVIQGYYFNKPLTAQACQELLTKVKV